MRGKRRLTIKWTRRLTRRYLVIEVNFVYLTRRSVVCRLMEGVAQVVGGG